jgi:hypothetical protein
MFCAWSASANEPKAIEHTIVYKQDGHFAGWPANNGIWIWGDEIVVGFKQTGFKFTDPNEHATDPDAPSVVRFGRSLDGGRTWTSERAPFMDAKGVEKAPVKQTKPVDFSHPDFAMRIRQNYEAPGNPRIYYSFDRCKTWEGPYAMPKYDQVSIKARTDYIVEGKNDAFAFITANLPTENPRRHREGRVFVTHSKDGGMNWDWVSWVGPEPTGFTIMPASVRAADGALVSALRRKEGDTCWIDVYRSTDDGKTWTMASEFAAATGKNYGNPPTLTALRDGRLAMAYGYRSEPYGMRAKISGDHGQTWGKEIILRDDAGCWDLGYPRTVQRADGKLVTIYYYNDGLEKERYIAATIWDPGAAGAGGYGGK